MDQIDAVQDVQRDFTATFNEAIKTHGVAATMTAVALFAAGAVHHMEHLPNNTIPASLVRSCALGTFTAGFHRYLEALNLSCDMKTAGTA